MKIVYIVVGFPMPLLSNDRMCYVLITIVPGGFSGESSGV